MLEKLFNSDLSDLQNALGRTTLRQSLLTNNLANVNVPGYKRKDIDFHIALQDQLGHPSKALSVLRDSQAQAASDGVSLRLDGNNVDMEKEVTGLAQTELHYEALTSMTANYFSTLKSAIREGK